MCEEVTLAQWRSGAGGGWLARVNVGAIWKREELREVRQDCGTCEELGASQERHGPYLPTFKVTMRKRMGYSY